MRLTLGRQVFVQHEVGPVVWSEIEHIFLEVVKEMKLLFIKSTVPCCLYVHKLLMCTDFLCVCVCVFVFPVGNGE